MHDHRRLRLKSVGSTTAAALKHFQRDRCPLGRSLFLSLTPRPPPFSSMNSTPPSSSAVRILVAVLVRPPIGPSRASNRLMVGVETPAASANSSCDQDSKARAAFI